jgi:2-hydroxychromene-2-carboxylate isomerase
MSEQKAPIDFWFDFLSPFGYLGSIQIEKLAAEHGREVRWRPTLLGVMVMNVMKLPAVPETPLKGPYSGLERNRLFGFFGVKLDPFGDGGLPPLPAIRTFTWLNMTDPALAKQFGQALYRAHWSEAIDVTTPEAVAQFAYDRFGLARAEVVAAIDDATVKDTLKASVGEALEIGVFGVPTFVIDGARFWGNERLPMIERLLATGSLEP